MTYNPSLVGAAAMAATTFYPLNSTNPDRHIAGNVGLYQFEMPAILVTVRGNYSLDVLPTARRLESAIETEFSALAKQWRQETGFHSSLSRKFNHPAYQRIMAMGPAALPLILKDLEGNSGHWFYALRYIAGYDVAIGTTDVESARSKWLDWGHLNNFI
jgi:hypothetical protein